ncbi:MAG: hypothetical protein ACI8ZB_000263 [Desulforhopalus sp.]|jgi:hypothetical protein
MTLPSYLAIFFILVLSANVYAGKADVTAVKVTLEATGSYNFEVTVSHSDEGWDHYADSWEVRDENGEVYGSRTLHHPHVSEQPFTRSLSHVQIPQKIKQVTVRAHDSLHLYGGKTVTVDLP